MRIAVAGGTGLVGALTVAAAEAQGHETVVIARSRGIDLVSGAGLAGALDGVDAVIDTTNLGSLKAEEGIAFFTAASEALIREAGSAGVGHLVALSIVGIDQMPYDYYAGKTAQERVVEASPVPWSIQRTTQFHEFAMQLFVGAKLGPVHVAPRARIQPVAAREVADRLVAVAVGSSRGRATDLAGPGEERLEDMIRAYARAQGHRGWIPSVSLPGPQWKGMRAGLGLPGAGADRGVQSFSDWIAALPAVAR
jgi:uncharacterized protein YbjT (DUF2867 family)